MSLNQNHNVLSQSNKVVLAFSGGLDTSFCAVYLSKDKGLDVHALLINTGAFSTEDIGDIKQRALDLGCTSFECRDVSHSFYQSCIRFLVFGNILKNNTYPLSVSAERVFQAIATAEYAREIGAQFLAHGSTGAGNDQVRFDLIFHVLCPDLPVITPIRDLTLSREEEIRYLSEHGYGKSYPKAAYSINKGLWGTSVGGKETLTSNLTLPDEAWPIKATKTEAEELELLFERGELVAVNKERQSAVELINKIELQAAPFGIGRDIHVGDTIIGIKGRVGFQAAAALIIIKAHHLLEKHTLTKGQMLNKDQLAVFYGNALHEGLFIDPVMRNIEAFFLDSQKAVNGAVYVRLLPYRFILQGITSDNDLMTSQFGSYGEKNLAWTGEDVKGYTKVVSNALMIGYHINRSVYPVGLGNE